MGELLRNFNHTNIVQCKVRLGQDNVSDHRYIGVLQATFGRCNRDGDASVADVCHTVGVALCDHKALNLGLTQSDLDNLLKLCA